jgi:hypothetical protein
MRKKASTSVETQVLIKSRRRCALCFGLHGDLREKNGQLAHVDRNPANSVADNLCYLCLEHHNQYDSSPSQSKGLTPGELRHYRQALYEDIEKFGIRTDEQRTKSPSDPIFLTLVGNSFSAGQMDLALKNDASPFNILDFEIATPQARIRQWHPRSLSQGDILRAPTEMPGGQLTECIYHMKVRDRLGMERAFQILVDARVSPPRYDFLEIS